MFIVPKATPNQSPFPPSLHKTLSFHFCVVFYFRCVFVVGWGRGGGVRDPRQLGGVCSLPPPWDPGINLQLLLMSHLDRPNLSKWIFLFGDFYINAATHVAFRICLLLFSVFWHSLSVAQAGPCLCLTELQACTTTPIHITFSRFIFILTFINLPFFVSE